LATHIAEIPHWVAVILSDDKYDIGKGFLRGNPPTKQEVLDIFNQYLTEARSSLANASDEMLNANWSMFRNGEFQFGFPKKVGIRNIVLNHIIHHRAQLAFIFGCSISLFRVCMDPVRMIPDDFGLSPCVIFFRKYCRKFHGKYQYRTTI
jgi:hypothetical protein